MRICRSTAESYGGPSRRAGSKGGGCSFTNIVACVLVASSIGMVYALIATQSRASRLRVELDDKSAASPSSVRTKDARPASLTLCVVLSPPPIRPLGAHCKAQLHQGSH